MPQKRNRGKRPKQPNFLDNLYEAVMVAMEDVVNDAIDAVEMNAGRIIEQQEAQTKKPRSAQGAPRTKSTIRGPIRNLVSYYDVLEVSPRASQEIIEAAYKSMAKKYHPDVSKDPKAEMRMKDINAAYETLGDAKHRKKYDEGYAFYNEEYRRGNF